MPMRTGVFWILHYDIPMSLVFLSPFLVVLYRWLFIFIEVLRLASFTETHTHSRTHVNNHTHIKKNLPRFWGILEHYNFKYWYKSILNYYKLLLDMFPLVHHRWFSRKQETIVHCTFCSWLGSVQKSVNVLANQHLQPASTLGLLKLSLLTTKWLRISSWQMTVFMAYTQGTLQVNVNHSAWAPNAQNWLHDIIEKYLNRNTDQLAWLHIILSTSMATLSNRYNKIHLRGHRHLKRRNNIKGCWQPLHKFLVVY